MAALAAFAVYRWRQQRRVRRVEGRVKGYLSERYGEVPKRLSIHRTDDTLWPVLVGFDNPRTGVRHSLQLACGGPNSTLSALSEKDNEIDDEKQRATQGRSEKAPDAGENPPPQVEAVSSRRAPPGATLHAAPIPFRERDS